MASNINWGAVWAVFFAFTTIGFLITWLVYVGKYNNAVTVVGAKCDVTADCGTGLICDPTLKQCLAPLGSSCQVDDDCTEKYYCDNFIPEYSPSYVPKYVCMEGASIPEDPNDLSIDDYSVEEYDILEEEQLSQPTVVVKKKSINVARGFCTSNKSSNNTLSRALTVNRSKRIMLVNQLSTHPKTTGRNAVGTMTKTTRHIEVYSPNGPNSPNSPNTATGRVSLVEKHSTVSDQKLVEYEKDLRQLDGGDKRQPMARKLDELEEAITVEPSPSQVSRFQDSPDDTLVTALFSRGVVLPATTTSRGGAHKHVKVMYFVPSARQLKNILPDTVNDSVIDIAGAGPSYHLLRMDNPDAPFILRGLGGVTHTLKSEVQPEKVVQVNGFVFGVNNGLLFRAKDNGAEWAARGTIEWTSVEGAPENIRHATGTQGVDQVLWLQTLSYGYNYKVKANGELQSFGEPQQLTDIRYLGRSLEQYIDLDPLMDQGVESNQTVRRGITHAGFLANNDSKEARLYLVSRQQADDGVIAIKPIDGRLFYLVR